MAIAMGLDVLAFRERLRSGMQSGAIGSFRLCLWSVLTWRDRAGRGRFIFRWAHNVVAHNGYVTTLLGENKASASKKRKRISPRLTS